ncbi:MAG TPA: hypothetical protein VGM60_12800 [Pseudonocardia sp.]|uniref:hypothetical protein n=1 Tax=Pseudonocardia sp. TaxID=60912 RepID=UPI002F3E3BB7
MSERELDSTIVLRTSLGQPRPGIDLNDNAALRDLMDDAGNDASGSVDHSDARTDQ